jgi:endonuclease/exonuclease/phosphatase family metal-dependent hydrolase
MPRYYHLRKDIGTDRRAWVIDRLRALRRQLRRDVSNKLKFDRKDAFLLATWNIRDFDSNKFGHGPRLREALMYMAEIVSTFDLVAVQEVNRNLKPLRALMDRLGPNWDYIVTDTTEGTGGNQERLAFLYNKHKILFRNVAGEIVLPKGRKIKTRRKKEKATEDGSVLEFIEEDDLQFARTPFVVAFQNGWYKFNLCTVHIYYGANFGNKLDQRQKEIAAIAKFFERRQKRSQEDYILLGDFNIVNPEHDTMKALKKGGFEVPEDLQKHRTNLGNNMHYDQIALRSLAKSLEIGASGVFDCYKSVYRPKEDDLDEYLKTSAADKLDFDEVTVEVGGKKVKKKVRRNEADRLEYYKKKWRTWQMSDHKPMWVELKTDFTEDYLNSLKPE